MRQRKKLETTNNPPDWVDYRRRRNDCTLRQRNDKSKFLSETFKKIESEKDIGKLFKTTTQLLGSTTAGPPSCLMKDGRTTMKQEEIAEIQSEYYTEKIKKIRNSLPKVNIDPLWLLKKIFTKWNPTNGKPKFNLKPVEEKVIWKMIMKMKNSHAYGTDGLDAMIVKQNVKSLAPIFTHIVNLSLNTARYPAKWKIARVIPLLKSTDADKTNPASYRPVSQLPLISKMTERAIQTQLLDYLEESNLLSMNHHAYRRKHSTITALVQLMDTIAMAADSNLITATLSMDLSAAFDCVDHEILKNKLRFYGLDVKTTNWIESYLHSRSSFVVIGSAKSKIRTTPQGVPQGSVMGPLLYLLYVNELPAIVTEDDCRNEVHDDVTKLFPPNCKNCGEMPFYADDGIYVISSKWRNRNQDKLENIFWRTKNFLNSNKLQVNESKTNLTEIMTHQKRSKLSGIPPDLTVEEFVTDRRGREKLEDKLITDSEYFRLLGLNLRNNLNWEAHLLTGKRAILPAVRKKIGMIAKIGTNMSMKARLNLTNSLAISKITYTACIWGNTTPNFLKKVQIVQNSAARMCTGMGKLTRQRELMDRCGWMDIEETITYYSSNTNVEDVKVGITRIYDGQNHN